jgi:hypothetical protein
MTVKDWERMARSAVASGTPLQYRTIARTAYVQGCGIWHATAVVSGAERCWCARCNGGAVQGDKT